jgi:septum formation protein
MLISKLILASQSPRRKQLLEMAEHEFTVVVSEVDEIVPANMSPLLVPQHLAREKAITVHGLHPDATIIGADTIVLLDDEILGKPADAADAVRMLQQLSGKKHLVITGVCIKNKLHESVFSVTTEVYFRPLTENQILHYVENYRPLDKAGAYAIQEWLGAIGIEKIIGDYYNVMGLPIGEVVRVLGEQF